MQDYSDGGAAGSSTRIDSGSEAKDPRPRAGNTGRNAPSRSAAGTGTSADPLDKAKQTISDTATEVGGKVASGLDAQKDKAAQSLGSVAQALRQASDQLRDQNEGASGHEYVASAANQVERLSGYLRTTNTREIIGNVEQFARQQPALFIGGAFMLGLLGARFLKSSGQSSRGHSASRYDASGSTAARENIGAPAYERERDSTYARGASEYGGPSSTSGRRTGDI